MSRFTFARGIIMAFFGGYDDGFGGMSGFGGFEDGRPSYGNMNAVSRRAENQLSNAKEAAKRAIVDADTSKGKAVFDVPIHLVSALRPRASPES